MSQTSPPAPGGHMDGGFTLIELIIYSALSVVVLLIVGGIFLNAVTAERTVRTANEATNAGQLASQSIGTGVRNASAISLTVPPAGGQLLRTRSVGAGDSPVWFCQAWWFGNGELRTMTSGSAIPSATASEVADWTLLVPQLDPTTAAPAGIFQYSDRTVDIDFEVANGEGAPILISTSAVSRQQMTAELEPPTCF